MDGSVLSIPHNRSQRHKKGQESLNILPVDDIGFSQGPPRGTEVFFSSLNPWNKS